MPVVPGLSKEQRKALVADQTADEGSEPIDLPTRSSAPVGVTAPTPDVTALIKMLADALSMSGTQTAETIREAMRESAETARNPIHETYLSGGYHGHSVYSHPDGDLAHPRTTLRCPMFMGVLEPTGKTIAAFEIFGDVCTEAERVSYNALVPGRYLVERNDGAKAMWQVVEEKDDLGATQRLIVGVPLAWLKKDAQAQMPSQKSFLAQLNTVAA